MSLVCPACGTRATPRTSASAPTAACRWSPRAGRRRRCSTSATSAPRKIKPQYTEGELVRVAIGRQQPEAELDPEPAARGGRALDAAAHARVRRPRDARRRAARRARAAVGRATTAREVLLQAEMSERARRGRWSRPGRVLALAARRGCLVALAVAILIIDLTVQ